MLLHFMSKSHNQKPADFMMSEPLQFLLVSGLDPVFEVISF